MLPLSVVQEGRCLLYLSCPKCSCENIFFLIEFVVFLDGFACHKLRFLSVDVHLCMLKYNFFLPQTGYYGNRGKHSLLDHSSSEKHKHIAAGVKGRIPGHQSMALVEDHNQNSQVTEVDLREAEVREGGSDGGERSNSVPSEVLRSTPTVMNHADKVTTAEAVWVLKMIESNFPFNSCENLVDVLKKMAPDSQILKDMTLKSSKSSYILRFGLYPFYLDQLVKRIQKSPTYTLGTDSGTFKLNGLAKIVDIDIRYNVIYYMNGGFCG